MKKLGWIIFKLLLAWLGLIIVSGIPAAVQASAQPDEEVRAAGTALNP